MKKETKKNNAAVFVIVVTAIIAIAFGGVMIYFSDNHQQLNNANNTVVKNVEPIVNGDEEPDYDVKDLTEYETTGDINKYVEKLKIIFNLKETNVSKDSLELLKGISLDVFSFPYGASNTNIESNIIDYAFFVSKDGEEVKCGDEYACLKFSPDEFEKILSYYNVTVDDLDISSDNGFDADQEGNYIIKVPVSGIEGPDTTKTFKTYKDDKYTYLMVTYKQTVEDKDYTINGISLYAFEEKNNSYAFVNSYNVNFNLLDNSALDIILNNKDEEYKIGKLLLSFKGTQTDTYDGRPIYKYSVNINCNNKTINTKIFNEVYSKNGTGEFSVYVIDNIYVIKSSVATIGYTDSVIIIDNAGNVLKEYAYANVSVDANEKTIGLSYTTDTSSSCHVHGGPETGCKEEIVSFVVSGSKLTIK